MKLALGWRARGPLNIGPLQIDGAATGSGALTGTFTEPRADLHADFNTIDLPALPLSDAHVTLSFLAARGGADGRFALAATSRYGPARAASAFRFAPGGLDLSGLDVDAGGVTASGSLALGQGAPSHADLHLAVGPGAVLTQGHATGQATIVDAAGGAHAVFSVTATDAVLAWGGAAFKSLTVSADGPLRRLPYRVKAQGALPAGPWRLGGGGILAEASDDRTLTFDGAGRLGRADLRTLSPAQFRFGPHGSGAKAHLAVGSGRADLDVSQGSGGVGAKGSVSNVSLALFNPDLIGRMDATLALAGRGSRLTGGLEARLSGAGGRDLKGAPPVDGLIKANLTDGAVTIDASLGNGQGLKAQGQVTLPAEASAAPFRIAINRKRPMRGRFAIDGELKPLWDLAMGGERSLAGRAVVNGTLGGTLADPRALGTASLDNGRFQDFGTGLKLEAVTLRATLADNAVDVGRFSGADGARGSVNGAGRVSLLRGGVSSFRLDLKAFRLIDNDLAQVTASGQASVNRAADGRVKLTGALAVDRAQIVPNPPVATGVVPMEVVEVHRPSDIDEAFVAPGPRAAPVALDVAIKAARGIFVKGRGLDVELSLDAHVSGTTASPILTGQARVVRGDYDFAGKRFRFDDRGVVSLGASAETIRLNLTATRDDPALTAVIRITGTAARPVIALTSSPVLPQDEILSQVLFGSSAAQLSPFEAAQLASALAGLSGGGGFDVIGGLRNFAHLDRLAIGGNA
ncbi:MAG: translocation/assembly module TamB domain-containing protein, partial [Pseudomonadota bacterium]